MKNNTNVNIEIMLLEKRLIDEEYATASLEKKLKLVEILKYDTHFTDIGKNGGLI